MLKKCPYVGKADACETFKTIAPVSSKSAISIVVSIRPQVLTCICCAEVQAIPSSCALFPCAGPSKTCEPAPTVKKKLVNPQSFQFDSFFENELEKKRQTSTYRIFRRILRDVVEYPFAEEFSSGSSKRVTVWCSNDYLGMSRHPKVREAAKYVPFLIFPFKAGLF